MPASKLFNRAPMRMMSLLLKGRGRWARVLNAHVVEAVLTHQLLLITLLAKVTMPGLSKHINRMTTTMIMKTYPWTLLRALSLGPPYLLVWQLKWSSSRWWTIIVGLIMCTRKGTPIPLFGKRSLMRISVLAQIQ
jgi:hypothetical protein